MSAFYHVKLPSTDDDAAVYGQSVAAYKEEEASELPQDIDEAQSIANLLPDDLFSDGFNNNALRPNGEDDTEDVDLFSSVGGLELGEEDYVNSDNQEHPSRTLFVRNIDSNIQDSDLQELFEQYGGIHTLHTACKNQGFVMISYFDIRASCNAMSALQDKPMMSRKLDIHFSNPKENSFEKDLNQGTMYINHDSSITNDELREILGVYGEIREIRESPQSSHHKFVEFYDVRAADSALHALTSSRTNIVPGKPIMVEAVQPGGSKRFMQHNSCELDQKSGLQFLQHSSPNLDTGYFGSLSLGDTKHDAHCGTIVGPHSANRGLSTNPLLDNNMLHHHLHGGISSSIPNVLSSLMRVESGNCSSVAESDHLQYHVKFDLQEKSNFHPRSLTDYYDGLTDGTSFGSPCTNAANFTTARPAEIFDNQQFCRISSTEQMEFDEGFSYSENGSCPPPGNHDMWRNLHHHHEQSQTMMWPPYSPSFVVDRIGAAHTQQFHDVHRPAPHFLSSLLNHQVGSAPSMNHRGWERQQHAHTAVSSSPDPVTVFHPGSLGNPILSGDSHAHSLLEYGHHNGLPRSVGNCVYMPSNSIKVHHPHYQRSVIFLGREGQVIPPMMKKTSFGSPPNGRTRNRSRRESSANRADNTKQFGLDVDRILRGDDKRTTLMIKNIPNRYTSKMLLAVIDERHKGTYDFIYLPIDFKNKSNVGYAFINMTDPSLIVPFYQTFNGKKWEKFNSEKVASLAYGRIQGKAALIAHFKNSSLMNEDKRFRPILFYTDGPKSVVQVPFPNGTTMRQKAGHIRASNEENNQEMPLNFVHKDDDYGDSSSGSGKE